CGSAAFLVAAARYLSARLADAWEAAQREHGADVLITPYGDPSSGMPEEELIPRNTDERGIYALRIAVERCLYGVDRNPLAVEMAKLSLWLLTLQRNRPFTFLDHAIRCGDSLLGVNLKQLSTWSLSGEGKQSVLFDDDLAFAADKREGLMKMQYRTGDQRRLLDAALAKTRRLRAAADRLIATAFEAKSEAAAAAVAMGLEEQEAEARKILKGRRPFHWPVEFPEVFLRAGGFDAIIGNPPFIGGRRITGTLGSEYREYLVELIGRAVRGHADYVAYFFLRAESLLKPGGTAGLLATNTIAQGDTREVGLDQMTERDTTIYRALPSRKWPGEANLEVAHVWFRKGSWDGQFLLDDSAVDGITSQLQPPSSVSGRPYRLVVNAGKSFQGSIVFGMGFVLEPEDAQRLLDKDPRNRDVLFPYLNGEDLNSRWDQSPSRWVINFRDWPLERAMEYLDCYEIVERLVKPERATKAADVAAWPWWQFWRIRPELYATIAGLDRVLVIPETTKYCTFSLCPTGIVFSHMTKLLALGDGASAAIVMSSIHEAWARTYSSTLETRLKYITSDGFETFPFPTSPSLLESSGERYHSHRRDIMIARREGLTTTYNRFHSPHEVSHDIATLRSMHVEMDHAVADAYGWTDLELGHGFHQTKQGIRYTISEAARLTVLDRLLALNHERYAAEQAAPAARPKPKAKARKRAPEQPGLF
ncbi:MAG TPA: hypothetical protein PLZ95_13050, partial [Bryobacteraceae bacterium]|nr:hypothetical protein [Bryobacteraceae bacterium]